jgi:DNA-binding transcriptional MerR regulator
MMNADTQGHLNVKAVSQLSGVTSHTLRAWERRYKAVSPERLKNGRRVYTVQDVERLKILRGLVERGHTISSVAKLDKEKLDNLLQLKLASEGDAVAHAKTVLSNALRTFHLEAISDELLRSQTLFNVRTFTLEIAAFFLEEIESLVKSALLTSDQEAAAKSLLRIQLRQILKNLLGPLVTPKIDSEELNALQSLVLEAAQSRA